MKTPLIIDTDDFKISELYQIEFDTPEGIKKILTGPPQSSMLNNNDIEINPVIAPYQFRVSEQMNCLAILANDPKYSPNKTDNLEFVIYNITTKDVSRIIISEINSSLERFEVVDFILLSNEMLYLLDRLKTKEKPLKNRLRLIDSNGKVVWKTEWYSHPASHESSLSGNCTGIVKVTQNILLIQTEEEDGTLIFKIDSKTGNAEKWTRIDNTGLKLFVDDNLIIRYITYISETNNKAYIKFDPETDTKQILYAQPDIYDALAFPSAIDLTNNIYCAQGFSISCVTPDLLLKYVLSINNIVKDFDFLLLSTYNGKSKELIVYKVGVDKLISETTQIALKLPGIRLGRLIGLSNFNEFVIETYLENNRQLFLYKTETGTLKAFSAKAHVTEFRLQAANTWQIDKLANIYLPVAGEKGMHIIKVSTE